MVFNATFKNISVISWRSVLLVEETEVTVVMNIAETLINLKTRIYVNRLVECIFCC